MSEAEDFVWPQQYEFPPFFTIQPNEETRKHQFRGWSQLILDYCQAQRIFILEKARTDIPLFQNKNIKRQLSVDALEQILEDMSAAGKAEWIDKKKDRCFVYWNTPVEWGNIIYDWAKSNGLLNTVETFFEIMNAETQFKGMDFPMLLHCLKTLEKSQKAELIGEDGVKFF